MDQDKGNLKTTLLLLKKIMKLGRKVFPMLQHKLCLKQPQTLYLRVSGRDETNVESRAGSSLAQRTWNMDAKGQRVKIVNKSRPTQKKNTRTKVGLGQLW